MTEWGMRYRFNLIAEDQIVVDEEGLILIDIEAARARAIDTARDILAGELRAGRLPLNWIIAIADDSDTVVALVRFADAVRVG
ncbi:DUF6894 family protein [Sphingomonas glacialis]|uniref:DUF6894 domain-containing protein n=1 Tax=Sphingomonas glacialis TaxID=658225 RepID=A0A502FRT6_9SPHN|nr:hypothetical protein [Sphingomonas glacialis]TPG51992.1 hypothetical protein EAH76_14765 [Sphingomonas glacialis]